jgi:glycopeptide antibiotics resistance protein
VRVRRHVIAVRCALAVWAVAVLVLTLRGQPGGGDRLNLTPGAVLRAGDTFHALADTARNVALFFPLGALAAAARIRLDGWVRVALSAASLSAAIEAVQRFGHLGRAADVDDVIANVLGALIGFALARALDAAP